MAPAETKKVAFITGGTSGVGLEVAKVLAAKGWTTHLLGRNATTGEAAAAAVGPDAHFHQGDVTDYAALAAAFDAAFRASGRLDFVFANAGIMERTNFYAKVAGTGGPDALPPPIPDFPIIDIGFKGFVHTAWLAQHYFRANPGGKDAEERDAVLLFHSSCTAFYGSQFTPIYAGAKAAIVNFMRSIAFPFHHFDGDRTYAICPGGIKTNLMTPEEQAAFPDSMFTPMEKVTGIIATLIEGGVVEDSNGKKVEKDANYGLTVEISNDKHYFRQPIDYCDELMGTNMTRTSLEYHIKNAS